MSLPLSLLDELKLRCLLFEVVAIRGNHLSDQGKSDKWECFS